MRRNNYEYVLLEFRLYRYFFDEETQYFTPLETKFTTISNAEIIESYGTGHDT